MRHYSYFKKLQTTVLSTVYTTNHVSKIFNFSTTEISTNTPTYFLGSLNFLFTLLTFNRIFFRPQLNFSRKRKLKRFNQTQESIFSDQWYKKNTKQLRARYTSEFAQLKLVDTIINTILYSWNTLAMREMEFIIWHSDLKKMNLRLFNLRFDDTRQPWLAKIQNNFGELFLLTLNFRVKPSYSFFVFFLFRFYKIY